MSVFSLTLIKPIDAVACSISEILSFAEHLDVYETFFPPRCQKI